MKEKRKLHRHHLVFYLQVYDRDTFKMLGRIVDITDEGMMLISDTPIQIGKTYNLTLKCDEEGRGLKNFDFEAESLHSTNDVNPRFYDTGFKINDPTDETLKRIKAMVDELGFAG